MPPHEPPVKAANEPTPEPTPEHPLPLSALMGWLPETGTNRLQIQLGTIDISLDIVVLACEPGIVPYGELLGRHTRFKLAQTIVHNVEVGVNLE